MSATFVFDLTGQAFGRLTVIGYAGKRLWNCVCSCGATKAIGGHYLRSGTSRSCGCLAREIAGNRYRRHGMKGTPEWECWQAMKQRCLNPKAQAYPRYGGRGIKVCGRWMTFENFYADMGPRPSSEHSIDRKDNDGDYEPSNCHWATKIDQNRNRSIARVIDFNGVMVNGADLAEAHGMTTELLYGRLDYGWSLDRALSTPVRKRRASNAIGR